ncbi:DMT family transporter [Paenibacillus cymbidii]|uniref:DMT family transporter n=1 Tax=Paenibacillus cymbidii TaxID=1639034 RepID=UPI001081CD3B|nr:multidrug efflux SMR transporter [Paenibacillus cymbidii]
MNAYILLTAAIASELFGSTMMKLSDGFRRLLPSIGMLAGMGCAFYCLSLALQSIPLGTAYAIWSGVGTAATALIGAFVFREAITAKTIAGLALIVAGVVVMRLAAGGEA